MDNPQPTIDDVFEACTEFKIDELHALVQKLQTHLLEKQKRERATLLASIQDEQERFTKEKDEWEALANKLSSVQLPEHIRLNVGGVVFATSRENLMRYENTFFSALLSGRWETNIQGEVFIDRSPYLFGKVIDFLRGDDTVAMDLSDADREKLLVEADFYQLDDLTRLCSYLENAKCKCPKSPACEPPHTVAVVRPRFSLPVRVQFVQHTFRILSGQRLQFDKPSGDLQSGSYREKIVCGLFTERALASLLCTSASSAPIHLAYAGSVPMLEGYFIQAPKSRASANEATVYENLISVCLYNNNKVTWTLTTISKSSGRREQKELGSIQLGEDRDPMYFVFSGATVRVELDDE